MMQLIVEVPDEFAQLEKHARLIVKLSEVLQEEVGSGYCIEMRLPQEVTQ